MIRAYAGICAAITVAAVLMLLAPPDARAQDTEPKDIFEMSLEELMTVKISTSGKTLERATEVPASIIIITRRDIETFGYTSLTQILEAIPGFYNVKDLLHHSNFGIRGFWNYNPNRNLIVMVNGVRQGEDVTGGNLTETIGVPVEAIDRIEVIKGPMSVMYGSGGFYGAVNIFTNIKREEDTYNAFSATYGSNNTFRLTGQASGKTRDLLFSVNGTHTSTDGLDQPYAKMGSRGDIAGNGSELTSKGMFQNTTSHLDAYFSYKDFWCYSSFDRNYMETAFLFQPLSGGSGSYEILNSFRGASGYKMRISPVLDLDLKLQLNRISHDYTYEIMADSFTMQIHPSSAVTAEMNMFYRPMRSLGFTIGLNYHSAYDVSNFYDLPLLGLTNMYTSTGRDPIQTQAAYLQAKWEATDRLLFVGGLRLERQRPHSLEARVQQATPHYKRVEDEFTQDDAIFVPRIAAIYSFDPNNVVKVLYGDAINRPSFFEKADMVGQPYAQLLPERIHTSEMNYTGIFSSLLTVSVSVFRNQLDNLIMRQMGFDATKQFYSYWSNSGELVTNGCELQLLCRPVKNVSFDIAATYQHTEDNNGAGRDVAYSPAVTGNVKASYAFWRGMTFALSGNYVGEMQPQWDSAPVDVTNPASPAKGRIGEKTPPSVNVSAHLRAPDMPIANMYIAVNVTNLLNEDIFSPATQNSVWAPKGTLDFGRSVMCTIGYRVP